MKNEDYQKIATADGSDSVWVRSLDETYHSRHGAVQEAQHVFIKSGLLPTLKKKSPVRVFEVGFGTGLNALLSWITANERNAHVDFQTVEKYPLPSELIEVVNYGDQLPNSEEMLQRLHQVGWNKKQALDDSFEFCKWQCDLDELTLTDQFDLVMYDAFGPRVQPNMWGIDKLQIVYNMLVAGGVLVTYCAQGQFRRNLSEIGFEWETLPGPPGKREMTRAIKKAQVV